MSKVTREEMLDFLGEWKEDLDHQEAGWYPDDETIYNAVRTLIEHGPEVDEAFVEKWNQKIAESVNVQAITEVGEQSFNCDLVYPGSENLRAMLTEAGVTVKEG